LTVPGPVTGEKRPREPDSFEQSNDMTLLSDDEVVDEMELWNSTRPFNLIAGDTLPAYWLRQIKDPATYRLAKLGLDMVAIPAMSSDCERVFSQCKLLITGQRNRLKPDIIEATQCLRAWLIMDRKAEGTWKGRGNWTAPLELYNNSNI